MELTRQGDLYRSGNLTLCPCPPEHVLVELYFDWLKSGVLQRAFYAQPVGLRYFLNLFSDPAMSVLGAYQLIDVSGQGLQSTLPGPHPCEQPIGLVWINKTYTLPAGFTRAEVAMAFRRHIKPSVLLTIGQMAVEWGFTERKDAQGRGLDCLIGTTPARNRAGWLFGKKIGFDVCGPIHGMCQWAGNMEDVMISSLDKDMWAKISPFAPTPPVLA